MNELKDQKVAIITRTKNRPIFLQRCIHTVLNQSYQNWVHVIVNDGGNLFAVNQVVQENMDAYHHRVVVIHNDKSLGMEAASNIGIKNSDSKYIVILDDDDTWHPAFLDQCVSCLANKRHPNIAGVITHSTKIIEEIEHRDGKDIINEFGREPFNQHLKSISISELAGENIFTVNSFVFERDALGKVGFYHEDLPVQGDWEFNLRFILNYEIDVIPNTLSYFHHRKAEYGEELANSMIKNVSDHEFYKTIIQNQLLRNDVLSGQAGLGTIISINNGYKKLQKELNLKLGTLERRFLLFQVLRWIKRKIFSMGTY